MSRFCDLPEDAFNYFDLNQGHEYSSMKCGIPPFAKAMVRATAFGPVGAPTPTADQKAHPLGDNERHAAELLSIVTGAG